MRRYDISSATFGRMSGSGERFVYRLEAGHDVRLKTVERVQQWIADCNSKGQLPEPRPKRRAQAGSNRTVPGQKRRGAVEKTLD